jgi:hypothetical protein
MKGIMLTDRLRPDTHLLRKVDQTKREATGNTVGAEALNPSRQLRCALRQHLKERE